MREADLIGSDSLMRLYFREDLEPDWLALRAAVGGDTAEFERLIGGELRTRPRPVFHTIFAGWALAAGFGEFQRAARLVRVATLPDRPPVGRVSGHLLLAELEIARGRWSAARDHLAAAAPLDPLSTRVFRAICAASPALQPPREDLEAIRRELLDWDMAGEPLAGVTPLIAATMPLLRVYLLGLVEAKLGTHDAALGQADRLERLDVPPTLHAVRRDFARTIRAQVAAVRGEPAAALDLLDPIRGEVPMELIRFLTRLSGGEYTFPAALDHARFLRAQVLQELGRDRDALRWLENGFDLTPGDLVYLAPRHLARAESYERAGELAQAREHYARFIELWQDADPELRPLVEDVRRRLARLAGEGG